MMRKTAIDSLFLYLLLLKSYSVFASDRLRLSVRDLKTTQKEVSPVTTIAYMIITWLYNYNARTFTLLMHYR